MDGGANDFCRQFTDDQGNPYCTGFIDGCMSIDGNTNGCLRVDARLIM